MKRKTSIKTILFAMSSLFLFSCTYDTSTENPFGNVLTTIAGVGNQLIIPAGVTVDPASGLLTSEDPTVAPASFTVALNSQPDVDVIFPNIASSNEAEGTVSPSTLTFTFLNWAEPQTVQITGVDDNVTDGNQPYTIILDPLDSGDARYSGFDPGDATATNTDNDAPGIMVNTASNPLITSETGGTENFSIVLNTEPTGDVIIGNITSGDTSEGTVSPGALTFTATDWFAPQTVTIAAQNDADQDGDITYTVNVGNVTSPDPNYAGLDPANVTVVNIDNDMPGITVSPFPFSLSTNETGSTATFTVILNSELLATNVTIGPITSSDTSEVTVAPSFLTFTATNWNTPQAVVVTGVDDDGANPPDGIADGTQTATIDLGAASGPIDYTLSDLSDTSTTPPGPGDGTVLNADDETAGITVTPTGGLTTTEAGGTAAFTIALNNDPQADVTISSLSINPGPSTEASLNFSSLTWTAATWNTAKTVVATGLDESIEDGDQNYTAVIGSSSSSNSLYNGIDPTDVTLTNTDNDTASVLLTTVDSTTGEDLSTANFNISLGSDPGTNTVIIGPIQSANTDEGTVVGSPLYITFTNANWNINQNVVVNGVNDDTDDGPQAYTIDLGSASGDPIYAGLDLEIAPGDVNLTNSDDDTAGVTVTPTGGLVTSEAGASDTFTVVLDSQPVPNAVTGNVLIDLVSLDGGEGTTTPISTLTFTTTNWGTAQTVTVRDIVNDALLDGDIVFTIDLTMHMATDDLAYKAIDPDDVTVTNQDDEVLDVVLSKTTATVSEHATAGTTTDTFTAVLTVEPAADVTVPFSVSPANEYEATVSPASLTFTALNWNTPQSLTVTGIDDHWYDTDQTVTIHVDAATGSVYAAYDDTDNVVVTVTDAEPTLAQFILSSVGETVGSSTFTDRSNSPHIVTTAAGTPTHENSGSPIPGSDATSHYLDGSDAIKSGDHADWQFGTGDFTIDFWLDIEAFPWGGPRVISYESSIAVNNGWQIIIKNDGDLLIQLPPSGTKTFAGVLPGSPAPTLPTGWHHYAIVRSGCPASCTITLYFDGENSGTINAGEGAGQDVSGDPSYELFIGYRPSGVGYIQGWVDNIRIYKGLARWTADFFPTPPATYFFPYSGSEPGPP